MGELEGRGGVDAIFDGPVISLPQVLSLKECEDCRNEIHLSMGELEPRVAIDSLVVSSKDVPLVRTNARSRSRHVLFLLCY